MFLQSTAPLPDMPRPVSPTLRHEIRYCRAPDGVRLAYAVVGNGPPLAKTANWFNHLEYDWKSPVWRYILHGLASDHTLIRYDTRGSGMSDWEVDELSLDACVRRDKLGRNFARRTEGRIIEACQILFQRG